MFQTLASLQTVGSVDELLTHLNEQLHISDTQAEQDQTVPLATRQPSHTVYVSADAYEPGLAGQWGRIALGTLDHVVGTPAVLASLVSADPSLAERLYRAVRHKLQTQPIEDLRLDFEDGLACGSEAEDRLVPDVARRLLQAEDDGLLPDGWGIRFKSLERSTRERAVRTLTAFVGAVVRDGQLPQGIRFTLPKVTAVEQVSAMARVCDWLESQHGLPAGSIRFEIQVETPQSVVLRDGAVAGGRLIEAAEGRCNGLHFGAYDYTAACGVVAKYQGVLHPASRHAKELMQIAASARRVPVSDGATITFPTGTDEQILDGLRHHAEIVCDALRRGYYQGWDMHPAQLITRYAATFSFYLDGFDEAAIRVSRYMDDPATSDDEPASIRALAGHLARAVLAGAVSESDAQAATGLTRDEIRHLAGL